MTKQRTLRLVLAMVALNFGVPAGAFAATMSADVDLVDGTAIPVGGPPNVTPVGAGPFTYNIDNDLANTGLQTHQALDMGALNITHRGPDTEDITINAASLSHGTGGAFDFSASDSGPSRLDSTICSALRPKCSKRKSETEV